MSNAQAGEAGGTLLDRFTSFLTRHRIVIWGVLGAVAAFLIVYFAYDEIRKYRSEEATGLVEEAAEHLTGWLTTEDEEKRSEELQRFVEKIDLILARYPRLYASQRALYLQAQYQVQNEAWEQAVEPFLELVRRFPESYLAPLSLFNAGVCRENAGDLQAALECFAQLTDDYPESHLAPHALFAVGRLREDLGATEEALAAYTRLGDEHPGSTWTQFAKNRIIAMELRQN